MLKVKAALTEELKQRKRQHLYRQRVVIEQSKGITANIGGKEFTHFCSNDYLGLASAPKLIQAQQKAVEKYGVGSAASQLVSGYSDAHHALELELAEFLQRPRVILFSSGFLANLGLLSALLDRGSLAFLDRLDHASLIDGVRYSEAKLCRYQHSNISDLEKRLVKAFKDLKQTKLKEISSVASQQTAAIITDGVFSMDGDVAKINELSCLATKYNALLIVDDAHGIGVLGSEGRGCLQLLDVANNQVDVLTGTFGKAFGTCGAFVSGDEELAEILVQKARTLIYSTALPAAIAETTRASLKLLQTDVWRREKLFENIHYFRKLAAEHDIQLEDSMTAIQPLIIGDCEQTLKTSEHLKQAGFLVTAIRSPTVAKGSARLRFTLSTLHDFDSIHQLVVCLAAYLKETLKQN